MKAFNVIIEDFNAKAFVSYNVMPYFINCYKQEKHKPKTFNGFKEFVRKKSLYQFWSRSEYEIVLHAWPCDDHTQKIDVFDQIKMNLDIVTEILMENVK